MEVSMIRSLSYRLLFFTILLSFMQFTLAQQMTQIERKPILSTILDSSKKVNRIEVKEINLKPNQATGMHFHPCPVVGYVSKGTVLFQIEGEKAKKLVAGDFFFEPANKNIIHFDNGSRTKLLTFVAVYLLGESDNEVIKML